MVSPLLTSIIRNGKTIASISMKNIIIKNVFKKCKKWSVILILAIALIFLGWYGFYAYTTNTEYNKYRQLDREIDELAVSIERDLSISFEKTRSCGRLSRKYSEGPLYCGTTLTSRQSYSKELSKPMIQKLTDSYDLPNLDNISCKWSGNNFTDPASSWQGEYLYNKEVIKLSCDGKALKSYY